MALTPRTLPTAAATVTIIFSIVFQVSLSIFILFSLKVKGNDLKWVHKVPCHSSVATSKQGHCFSHSFGSTMPLPSLSGLRSRCPQMRTRCPRRCSSWCTSRRRCAVRACGYRPVVRSRPVRLRRRCLWSTGCVPGSVLRPVPAVGYGVRCRRAARSSGIRCREIRVGCVRHGVPPV